MGYLNSQPGDDELIAAMGENGTDQVPGPSLFQNTGETVGKDIIGGLASDVGAGVDALENSFDKVRQYFADAAGIRVNLPIGGVPMPVPGVPPITDVSQPVQPQGWEQDISDQRVRLEKWIDAGKPYEGAGAQTLGSVAQGLAEAAPGMLAGPVGAAALLGAGTADDTYRRMVAHGVDENTAKELASFQGGLAAAGGLVPIAGSGLIGKLITGAAGNVAFGAASRYAQSAVLDANGYRGVAQQPFDAQQMLVDGIIGAGMGGFGHAAERATSPVDVDVARTVADEMHVQNAAPGIPTNPKAANLHEALFARAAQAAATGHTFDLSPEEAQTMVEGVIPNPDTIAQQAETAARLVEGPTIAQTLRMSPKLDAAEAAIDGDIAAAQPLEDDRLPLPDAENDAMLRHLERVAGNAPLQTEDGETITVAQLGARLRQQAADADINDKMMQAAIGCFLSTGGIA